MAIYSAYFIEGMWYIHSPKPLLINDTVSNAWNIHLRNTTGIIECTQYVSSGRRLILSLLLATIIPMESAQYIRENGVRGILEIERMTLPVSLKLSQASILVRRLTAKSRKVSKTRDWML